MTKTATKCQTWRDRMELVATKAVPRTEAIELVDQCRELAQPIHDREQARKREENPLPPGKVDITPTLEWYLNWCLQVVYGRKKVDEQYRPECAETLRIAGAMADARLAELEGGAE